MTISAESLVVATAVSRSPLANASQPLFTASAFAPICSLLRVVPLYEHRPRSQISGPHLAPRGNRAVGGFPVGSEPFWPQGQPLLTLLLLPPVMCALERVE